MSAIRELWLGPLKSWTRTTSFFGKEVVEVVRRPGALFSLILGPFVIMGLFGIGYSGVSRPLETIIVVPDNSDLPRDASFYQPYAGDSVHIAQITNDVDAARAQLLHQDIDLVVIAPANVEEQFRNAQQSTIGIEYNELDPVRDNYARFVANSQIQALNQAIIEQAVTQGEQYMIATTGSQPPVPVSPQVVAAPTRADNRRF